MATRYSLFVERWKGCTACPLHKTRQHVVLARGSIPCRLLFVGEAPGESEDVLGKPFSGPAGHLLQYNIIDRAVPSDVTYALANLVCCIPRDEDGGKAIEPEHEDILSCGLRLQEFVEIADPELIITVGRLATDYLDDGYKHSIKFEKRIPRVSIVHPAAIIRYNQIQMDLAIRRCCITVSNSIREYLQ